MCRFFRLLLILLLCSSPVRADWINLTGAETSPNIAEIYFRDDHVQLVLEAYVGDLETFEALPVNGRRSKNASNDLRPIPFRW